MIKPPLIYLGNKFRFLSSILPLIHPNRTLIEPFVGSGAVFLNAPNQTCVINDLNQDVINLHQHVRFAFPELIKEVTKVCNPKHDNAETYYQLREEFNQSEPSTHKTALFLYINYYGFKGLIRYAKGRINVPYHQGFAISNYSFKKLHETYQALKTKNLTCHSKDFRAVLDPQPDQTIYADPPFSPAFEKVKCEGYLGKSFEFSDHEDLVELAEEYRKLGSTFIISNHLTSETRELYVAADRIIKLTRNSGIRGDSIAEKQPECLAVYGKPFKTVKSLKL